jgi:DNA-directed RNA polymerase specialized sigma24 family protein
LRDVALERTIVTSRDAADRAFREHGLKLWRSLLAFTGDPELASDAMAEAYAQLLARGAAVRAHERWVWRAAFRIAAGELQDRRRRRPWGVGAVETYEMPEPALDLIEALGRLSPNQRAVAVLRLYADLPSRDVARILGMGQATVRVHLSQARRRLRSMLEEPDERPA